MTLYAYCYRSGQIKFGRKVKKGALGIAHSDRDSLLRGTVAGLARLAYDNKILLVPGIPEANNDEEAMQALERFMNAVKKRLEAHE